MYGTAKRARLCGAGSFQQIQHTLNLYALPLAGAAGSLHLTLLENPGDCRCTGDAIGLRTSIASSF